MSDKSKNNSPNTDDVITVNEPRKPDWDWKAIFDKISSLLDGLAKAFTDPEGFAIWKKINGWSPKPEKKDWELDANADKEKYDAMRAKKEPPAPADPVIKEELSMKKVSEEAREEFNFAAASKSIPSSSDISPDVAEPLAFPAPGGIKNNAA